MSGDVQPRKRKDKKKRKEDGDQIPEKIHTPIFTNNSLTEDVNIHVHKEGGTGGGICAKLVFFILFSALAVLIGLIITEHRGLTDLDTADPNSKFSQLFEGWVDINSNTHDDHQIEDGLIEDNDHDDELEDKVHISEEDNDSEHENDDEDDVDDEQIDEEDGNEEEEEDQIEEENEDKIDDEDDKNIAYDDDELENDEEEINTNASDEDDDVEDDQLNEDVEEEEEEELNDDIDEDEQNDEDVEDGLDETVDETKEKDDEDDDIIDGNELELEDQENDQDEEDQNNSEQTVSTESPDDDNIDKDDEDDNDDEGDNDNEIDNNGEGDNDDIDDIDHNVVNKNIKLKQLQHRATKEQSSGIVKSSEDELQIENHGNVDTKKTDEDNINTNEVGSSGHNNLAKKTETTEVDYEYANITNEDDYKIREQIDEAQNSINNNNSYALALFDNILQKFPSSPRALYGKALTLDLLADKKRSNDLLEEALQFYVKLLKAKKVPTLLFSIVADRSINRLRFLGQYRNAIKVHKIITDQFPNNPKYLNDLAVTYLSMNRIEDARAVLKEILRRFPEDGFALVHYGFILKTTDNDLEKAVRYLNKGILTKAEGVVDGRFYFHLGDALTRLGRNDEALKIYQEGTKNKVFLSVYQRSLYNVPRLSSKPWWRPEQLPYTNSLKILSESWQQIKEEGLSILSETGYFQDESENLKDTGEWKQFELFARGHKNIKNCRKCPFTCNIIDQIPEAKGCRRGQTKFSVMHAGTHVWPHCGPTNCRLRVHLGLKVPLHTFIRVADTTKSWREGELLIFDDSFEHEVWHNGTDFRLILIVDIWHPELTPSERNTLSPI